MSRTVFGHTLVLDISDPAKPVELGASAILTGTVFSLALGADALYAGLGTETDPQLCILDLEPVAVIVQRGCLALAGPPHALRAEGTTIYVAAYDAGLDILDVSDADRPSRLATFATRAPAYDLDLGGGRAYVAVERVEYQGGGRTFQNPGIRMIDVVDPARPGDLGTWLDAVDLAWEGDYAYVLSPPKGQTASRLDVFDLRDPARPIHVGRLKPSGDASVLAVADGWLYLAGDSLEVYELSEPSRPERREQIPLARTANVLQIEAGRAYLGSFGTDLRSLQGMAGHADISTTALYVHLAKKAQRKALQEHAL